MERCCHVGCYCISFFESFTYVHYRYDMTKPQDFYWMAAIKRTLEDIRECCLKRQFSCDRTPLLNIPLENSVLDELHLMLRITGKCTTPAPPPVVPNHVIPNLFKVNSSRGLYHVTFQSSQKWWSTLLPFVVAARCRWLGKWNL
jgi:hypothetical protein